MNDLYSPAVLKEWLNYDPLTGLFRWLKNPPKKIIAGEIAGGPCGSCYVGIMFQRRHYLAHRLAWVYMTGKLPSDMIDHINGIPNDNRWVNLRSADFKINNQNRRRPNLKSKTGVLGVTVCGSGFRAIVRTNGKNHYSTVFATVERAFDEYVTMKRRLHQGCTL